MEFMPSLQNGIDELKPSLFELLAEQELSSLLPPTLRYLLATATHRYPRYLLRVLNSFDELYALLFLAIERYYLRTYGGSFTENFYGLKRERVLRVQGGEVRRAQLGTPSQTRDTFKLRERDVWKNLAIMIGLPYLKRKLDEGYEIHAPAVTLLGQNYDRERMPTDGTIKQMVLYCYKWFLRKCYPTINAAYWFFILSFNLAYLFDGSRFHDPFLWLIGVRMRRMGDADYRAIAQAAEKAQHHHHHHHGHSHSHTKTKPGITSIFHPRNMVDTVYPRMLSSLRILLPTSIFALKFLEWWHQSDFARQLSRKAAEGLELPPPANAPDSESTRSKTPGQSILKNGNNSHLKTTASSPTQSDKQLSNGKKTRQPPIAAKSGLRILTVPQQPPATSNLCPICNSPITTATATPYGYVFCYVCIHKWVEGSHERQIAFMEGGASEEAEAWAAEEQGEEADSEKKQSREGVWESGVGRCAVTGKRILGGTEGLRRVVV